MELMSPLEKFSVLVRIAISSGRTPIWCGPPVSESWSLGAETQVGHRSPTDDQKLDILEYVS